MHVSADHLLAQARERFALQDYYGAAHLLEAVLETGKSFADVHHLLGLCLAMIGQRERALAQFEQALALNPRYIEANIHRGILLNELGREDEAAAAFQAAVGNQQGGGLGYSRQVAGQLANLHAGLGEAYADAGAPTEAIEQFRRAIALGPNFHDLRYRLARLLLEAGRPLEAREELESILAEHPEFHDARASLGLAHYLAGDAASARELWARFQTQGAADPRVDAYLAMAQRLPA